MDCLFCKITNNEIASDVIMETDRFLVFKDIHPKASVHVLVVPRAHIASVDDAEDKDADLLGEMFLIAKKTAEKIGVSRAYRLQINVGKDGGQEIEHIHMHLLSERKGVDMK